MSADAQLATDAAPVTVEVYGTPAPQGSKRGFAVGGRVRIVESSAKVRPWRQSVVAAFRDVVEQRESWLPFAGPVLVEIEFYLPRPQSERRARYSRKRPDLDKLARSTLDGLTDAGAFVDDAQVAELTVRKLYVDELRPEPGAEITVESLA